MIRRTRLFTVAGAALTLLLAMLGVVFLGGAAFPFALGNVGSFGVSGTTIDTGNPQNGAFNLVPTIDQNSGQNGSQLPAGQIHAAALYVDGLVLEKTFDLPGGLGTWKLRIATPAKTTLTNVTLNTAQICSSTMNFVDFGINAQGSSDPLKSLELTATRMTLTNAAIETTDLRAGGLALVNPQLSIQRGGYDPVAFGCFK